MHIVEYQKKKDRKEEIYETIMNENFPQINVRQQITDPESSENSNQKKEKCKQTNKEPIDKSFSKYRKSKIKRKSCKIQK